VLKKANVAICCFSKCTAKDEIVVFDGGANVSMFHSERLVTDVWNVREVKVKGIDKRGCVTLKKKGTFLGTEVWVSPQASTNILCAKDAKLHHDIFELSDWGVRLIEQADQQMS
jgi:hypothetical protein